MNIRRALNKDTKRILELLVQVNNVHNDGRPDLFIRDKTKYTETELLNIIRNDKTPVFCAVDETDSVLGYGFCVIQSHETDDNWHNITTLYIDDICVDEKYRGKHIGKALYEYITEYARKSGCYNITLNVWEKNPEAKAFYEKMGMSIQKTGMEKIL
jgi:ribosomal protein S18 acetylase RimI-like enzyme